MFKRSLFAGLALCAALVTTGCHSSNACRSCGPTGPTIVGSGPVPGPGPCCNGGAPPAPAPVQPIPSPPFNP
jgi:hypothetical protein